LTFAFKASGNYKVLINRRKCIDISLFICIKQSKQIYQNVYLTPFSFIRIALARQPQSRIVQAAKTMIAILRRFFFLHFKIYFLVGLTRKKQKNRWTHISPGWNTASNFSRREKQTYQQQITIT
jgi:hypothetical protein